MTIRTCSHCPGRALQVAIHIREIDCICSSRFVNQKFDSRGPCVGEQVAVMGLGATEDLHHAREQSIGASAHVHRLGSQPQGVDANHRSSFRSHPAHSAFADIGQVTVAAKAPPRNSMRTS